MSEQPDPLMARVPLETRSRVVELLAVIDERDAEIERLQAKRQKWLALERAVRNMKVYPGLAVDLAMQELPDE